MEMVNIETIREDEVLQNMVGNNTSQERINLTDQEHQENNKHQQKNISEKKSFYGKLLDELRPNKKLFRLKILSFLYYAGAFSATPFYTLHMQQLGISLTEISAIYSVLPIPSIMGPVVSGIIADWSSNFKAVLISNFVLAIVFNLATVFTPPMPPAPPTAVTFASEGVLMSPLQCDDTTVADRRLEDWVCVTSCFEGTNITQSLSTSPDVFCKALDTSNEIPMVGCAVAMADEFTCGYPVTFSPQGPGVSLHKLHRNSHYHSTASCSVACNYTALASSQASGFSNSRTFWVYFLLRMAGNMFIAGSFTMMDACSLAIILRVGGDYGKQRLVAMLSMAIFPFLSSWLVHTTGDGDDYSIVFYCMAVLLSCACVVAYYTDMEVMDKDDQDQKLEGKVTRKKRGVFHDIIKLLSRVEVAMFLVVIFLLGAYWGYLENFLFVYLASLDAPAYLLGLTMTFGCLTGVPMLLVSDRIVAWLGREKIFVLGFLAYTVRMFGYSFITNPWYCFIFEALEVFTYQIMWVACVTYFPILAPPRLLASLAGIAGAIHYNIGRGGGAFIGGLLIAHIGMVWTFRAFGVGALVFAVCYLAIQRTCLDKVVKNKQAEEEDNEEEDDEEEMKEEHAEESMGNV